MKNRFPAMKSNLPGLATSAAWLFIVSSLIHVTWSIAVTLNDPTVPTPLYATIADGEQLNAIGLTYAGFFGVVWAIMQLTAIGGAAALTLLPAPRKWRRLAHGLLVAWAGLFTFNLFWLALQGPTLMLAVQSMLMLVMFGGTAYRARQGWNRRMTTLVAVPLTSSPTRAFFQSIAPEPVDDYSNNPNEPIPFHGNADSADLTHPTRRGRISLFLRSLRTQLWPAITHAGPKARVVATKVARAGRGAWRGAKEPFVHKNNAEQQSSAA